MKTFNLEMTPMMLKYLVQFVIRLSLFGAVMVLYITNKSLLMSLMTHSFRLGFIDYGVTILHFLWLVFMIMMIRHLQPTSLMSMALRKGQKEVFRSKGDFSQLSLLKFVQKQNYRAWIVLLVWLCFNTIFGILYLFDIIDEADLLMLSVFYFLSDYICIIFFCPFQTFIMKNRCCVNCRIYDWGHFMMFTPMLFIRNFFSWSLFFTALIVLIRWEILYAKYPERFWIGSNHSLECKNCKDKTCQIKKGIAEQVKAVVSNDKTVE